MRQCSIIELNTLNTIVSPIKYSLVEYLIKDRNKNYIKSQQLLESKDCHSDITMRCENPPGNSDAVRVSL